MYILLTYDVNVTSDGGAKRLRRVAKQCEKYGLRVQNSVFELDVDQMQLTMLQHALIEIMDESEDSIRIYHLGKTLSKHVTILGKKQTIEQTDAFIL